MWFIKVQFYLPFYPWPIPVNYTIYFKKAILSKVKNRLNQDYMTVNVTWWFLVSHICYTEKKPFCLKFDFIFLLKKKKVFGRILYYLISLFGKSHIFCPGPIILHNQIGLAINVCLIVRLAAVGIIQKLYIYCFISWMEYAT